MKVTTVPVIPTSASQHGNRAVTPELLASVLGKYSRSAEGLDAILDKVDLANPQASIERILRHVDYGHGSIAGLTGTLAVAIDGVTMWLAYQLFACSPRADGQESSTRYIKMGPESLADFEALGLPKNLARMARDLAEEGLKIYQSEYERLDRFATENPDSIRYPDGANDKVKARIRVNYALDRARYFLSFAMKTNIALVQTARDWAHTISCLLSMGDPEATQLAELLKGQLIAFAPNLAKHARAKPGLQLYYKRQIEAGHAVTADQCPYDGSPVASLVDVIADGDIAEQEWEDLKARENRYDACPWVFQTTPIELRFEQVAVAELRDLNRHRPFGKYTPLAHTGLWLPPEISPDVHRSFLVRVADFHADMAALEVGARSRALFLGSTSPFNMTGTLDKMIYMFELRTGPGAHFAYADLMRKAVNELEEVTGWPLSHYISLGQGEPE